MAAVAQLQATKQAPLPLKATQFFEDYPTTRVTYTTSGTPSKTSKQDLVYAPDASDKERLLRAILDYERKCSTAILNIADTDRHVKLIEILGGHMQLQWETHLTNCSSQNDADFQGNVRSFLLNYLPSNAFHIQKEYLSRATKPYNMDCFELASRLQLINEISVLLPGSSGKKLFLDDLDLKTALYRAMLPAWQLAFEATGNLVEDKAYTIQRLAQFFETQRLHHNALSDSRRRQNQQNGNRGFRANNTRGRPYPSNGTGFNRNNGNYRGNSSRSSSSYSSNYQGPSRNFRNQGTQYSMSSRTQGSQTQSYPAAPTSRTPFSPAHTRSRTTPPRRARSDANRETRNLQSFYGQRGRHPQGSRRSPNDMYYQGEPLQHTDPGSDEQYFGGTLDYSSNFYPQQNDNDGYFAHDDSAEISHDQETSDGFFAQDNYAPHSDAFAQTDSSDMPYDAHDQDAEY
jgi:hypothetical protein